MRPVKFGIVGIGGYAKTYHEALAKLTQQEAGQLVAVAEWNHELFSTELKQLSADGVKIFKNYAEMLSQCSAALDFIGLPVGIHWHAPMTLQALRAGCHVICEKPVAATIQDVDAMIRERDAQQKMVLIGYQEIYSPSIRLIKQRVAAGQLGKVKSIKVKAGWPRPWSYYARNNWAGKLQVNSSWVLDGPANNALAHYINNMLFVASPDSERAAIPITVQAELYRANDIESYDTVSLRAELDTGAKMLFVASHASDMTFDPEMTLECEHATVIRKFQNGETVIKYFDGRQELCDDENINTRQVVFQTAVSLFNGQRRPYCSLEIARSHTRCINGMHESCPNITSVPANEIFTKATKMVPDAPNDENFNVIRGIDEMIEAAYRDEKLFSELDVSWTKPAKKFDLRGYSEFPENVFL